MEYPTNRHIDSRRFRHPPGMTIANDRRVTRTVFVPFETSDGTIARKRVDCRDGYNTWIWTGYRFIRGGTYRENDRAFANECYRDRKRAERGMVASEYDGEWRTKREYRKHRQDMLNR